jgi:hypothetical protein
MIVRANGPSVECRGCLGQHFGQSMPRGALSGRPRRTAIRLECAAPRGIIEAWRLRRILSKRSVMIVIADVAWFPLNRSAPELSCGLTITLFWVNQGLARVASESQVAKADGHGTGMRRIPQEELRHAGWRPQMGVLPPDSSEQKRHRAAGATC